MKLYLIEYYDTVSDRTEYDTIFGLVNRTLKTNLNVKWITLKLLYQLKDYKKVRIESWTH